jgi:hypothetical protein
MPTFAAEYFDKMFKGNFKEALEDSAEFSDDDPEAWTFLIDWCYEGKLRSIPPPPRTQSLTKKKLQHVGLGSSSAA